MSRRLLIHVRSLGAVSGAMQRRRSDWRVGPCSVISRVGVRLVLVSLYSAGVKLGLRLVVARRRNGYVAPLQNRKKVIIGHVSSSSISVRVNLPSPHSSFLDA